MTLALITGGSGHVGANLSRELINQGYKVRCIDYDNDYRAFKNLDIELIKADITDKDSLKPAFKDVEVVFHTAAFISLDRRYENLIRKINVEGTKNVCEASVDANIKKLVHFSSIDAFQREPMDEPLYESRNLVSDPKSIPYDLSKADGQRIVLDFTNNYLDASIIHPTSIMGPNDFKPGLNCQSMIDIANQKRLLNIDFGYNYVDVRDLSKTAINCSIKGVNGQNYLVGGEFLMFPEIAKMIGKLLD
ncbi:NAD-dependent epimerase/dehydratase family protein, partial [Acidimicrobiaceae bacterium]|nr:NAD-dependent epimerase/dehydratase family protein [Acidimicrobiaceae bacterium]